MNPLFRPKCLKYMMTLAILIGTTAASAEPYKLITDGEYRGVFEVHFTQNQLMFSLPLTYLFYWYPVVDNTNNVFDIANCLRVK